MASTTDASTIDPAAQAVLDRLAAARAQASPLSQPRGEQDWVAGYRGQLEGMAELSGPPLPLPDVQDHSIEGPDGPLALRVYRPASGVLPVLLFCHGGGFVGGSLASHDPALRALAHASGWLVAAVAYRLAPEHPFPAAPEDCYAALSHLAAHADALGADPARLAVAGDSAGGLLAAAVALMARDRGGPALRLHICLYPNMDLRPDRSTPSMAEHDGAVVDLAELARGLRLYLPDGADPAQPYASPGLAPDLAGLPPALVVTCECDPLRDEGEAYARRLRDAGVPVEQHRLPGMIHGVLQMAAVAPAGWRLMDQVAARLRAEPPGMPPVQEGSGIPP